MEITGEITQSHGPETLCPKFAIEKASGILFITGEELLIPFLPSHTLRPGILDGLKIADISELCPLHKQLAELHRTKNMDLWSPMTTTFLFWYMEHHLSEKEFPYAFRAKRSPLKFWRLSCFWFGTGDPHSFKTSMVAYLTGVEPSVIAVSLDLIYRQDLHATQEAIRKVISLGVLPKAPTSDLALISLTQVEAAKHGYKTIAGISPDDPRYKEIQQQAYLRYRPENVTAADLADTFHSMLHDIVREIDLHCRTHDGKTPEFVMVDGPGLGTLWNIPGEPHSGTYPRPLSPIELALVYMSDMIIYADNPNIPNPHLQTIRSINQNVHTASGLLEQYDRKHR